jgi:gliding motility-associated-like protein
VQYNISGINDAENYFWEFTGTGAIILGNNKEDVQINFNNNATNGFLSVKGGNKCGFGNSSPLFPISLKYCESYPSIDGIKEVCQGQTDVEFSALNMEQFDNYTWIFSGNGASFVSNGTEILIDFANNATSGELKVIGNKIVGIEADSASIYIVVDNLPNEAETIIGQHEVCYNQNGLSYYTSMIKDAVNYIWEYTGTGVVILGSGEEVQINFSLDATNGFLSVRGYNGCGSGKPSPLLPISLNFCELNPSGNLNIPNSFSPNGDGINEVYFIRGLTENTILLIFDRAGKKLYESVNYMNNWDGRDFKGQILESGTYWYTLIIPGIPTEFKGYVYIKR